MSRHSKPRTNSCGYILREFFSANPGEWLTLDDAMAKTGCGIHAVRSVLEELQRDGLLERTSVWLVKPLAAEECS